MKNLSLILAIIILAASLCGCVVSTKEATARSSNIRVTSSDAENAAAWLTERLGERISDRIVLGTDSDGYGVDVSALEDDGYIIRSFGDETALFAKTSEGLDRAARKYAKTVERGESVADETYHEGARVEKLTIAGNDIADYSVFVEDDSLIAHQIVESIAPSFVSLVEVACGAKLSVGDESASHRVVFRRVEDENRRESDFRYFVSDGDLIFEYSMKLGAKYGMVAFFEEELGWRDLDFGYDYLPEATTINVPEDRDYSVKPLFARGYDSRDNGYVANTGRNTLAKADRALYNFRSRIPKSSHGLQYNGDRWAGQGGVAWYQICYTNENLREQIIDAIIRDIEQNLNAGLVIGDTLTMIDCGQGDNLFYCHCKNCVLTMAEENNSEAGPVIRWMNAVESTIDEEGYDGLIYTCFAYHGSNRPCKTRPNDDVYVTFCLDGNCSRHLLDGSQCQWMSFDMAGVWGQNVSLNNRDFIEWIKGWGELTDNLYVWYYALDNNLYTYSLMDNLYDDLKLLSELNVAHVHMESEAYVLGFSFLINELAMRYTLHPDMTREEFNDAYCEILELTYGDGWRNAYEAIAFMDECELRVEACRNCWGYSLFAQYDNLDYPYYLARWDEICEMCEETVAEACTPWQEYMGEILSVHFIYNGCFGAYFPAYESDDAEMMALIEERWVKVCEFFIKNGLDPFNNNSVVFDPHLSIHEFAWTNWIDQREHFFPEGTQLKPVPAEYVKGAE